MTVIQFVTFFAVSLTLISVAHAGDDYVEPGRFGIEGTISTGGFQAGFVRETDQYEIGLDLDSFTSTSGGVATGDLGVELRAGKRFNLGTYNYLSVGAGAQTSLFSVTNGVSTNGSYIVGPYIGLQRHFSGTDLMLTIYFMPVSYSYTPDSQGSPSTQTWQFFEQGAFGIAYLF